MFRNLTKLFFLIIVILLSCVINKIAYARPTKFKHQKVDNYHAKPHSTDYMNGIASCYATKLIGRRTTSGQIFSMDRFTGAHPTLPMGTKLKVTNLKNNKVVYIAVNDRMSKKSGHVIDLTLLAAKQINVCPNLAEVSLDIIDNNTFNQILNGNTSQVLLNYNPLLNESSVLQIANQYAATSNESDINHSMNKESSNKDN